MVTLFVRPLCRKYVQAAAKSEFILSDIKDSAQHAAKIAERTSTSGLLIQAAPPRNLFCTSSYVSPPPKFGDDVTF